jgi:hypothetical protein
VEVSDRPPAPMRTGFTFRQLVTLVLVMAAVSLLAPVGARAAGTLVSIVDPSTGNKARVDAQGRLSVGTLPVGSKSWQWVNGIGGGLTVTVFNSPSSTTQLRLTSVTVTNVSGSDGFLDLWRENGHDCNTQTEVDVVQVALKNGETQHVTFPEPLVVHSPGVKWSLCAGTSGPTMYLIAIGGAKG